MLAIRPRIFHKGLILLLVPLSFEVAVAASLIYLQHYYEESVQAEAWRKQIVFHINELWFHSTGVTTHGLAKALVKDWSTKKPQNERALSEYRLLKALLAQDDRQRARLEDIMACFYRCRAICSDLAPAASDAGGRLGQILALKKNLTTCKRLLAANSKTGDMIRSFRESALLQSVRTAEQVSVVARLIQLVLAGAIVGSAVIAFFLFRYFMRGINVGVQTLVGNIERFKRGEPLAPAIEGADEIALLDARFHEMAEAVAAAQRMKHAFVSTLSSEFRAPFIATREYLARLSGGSDSALSERGRIRAQQTEKSLLRLIGLMNDLLALQAPGISRIEISPRRCSLTEVTQSAIDAVAGQAEMNGIRLVGLDEQVEAYADPDRIVQVLVNLLSNAIKFSPPGSSVVVSTQTVDDEVEVRVRDTGRGIPAHRRQAIFERFQQVAASDATEKGGTGLGLPICKDIVELHGCKMGVETEEGKGSTFWFRLPARPKTERPTPSGSARPPSARTRSKTPRTAPRTIYAKGLILICVPLLVEVAFGVSMFPLQHYYQEKQEKERAAMEIMVHANEMWINCTEIILMNGYFNLFGGPKPALEERTKRIKEEYGLLKDLVAKDSEQRQNLERVQLRMNQALEWLGQLRPVVSSHLPSSDKLKTLMSNLSILGQVEYYVNRGSEEIEFFSDPEFLHSAAAIPELERATSLVDQLVLGSLAASALVAVVLFAYFIRTINRGVAVVVENTERFKQGLELRSPVGGGDELAQVDAAFHEMAREIREAQQTKQAIVSMISHDLRSPLTSVLGYLLNVTDGILGDVSSETISNAQKCERDVERLIALISDLLDLDKIEAGKFELRLKALPADGVIERAIATVLPFAEENGVTIQGLESSMEIYADPDRIVQALANVLLTAVRLSSRGARVETCIGHNDSEADISITSASACISEDRLNAMFDRYQQSESGLRLELPISREIIRLHGGTIGASSQHPQGVAFWLRLPCTGTAQTGGLTSVIT